MAGSGGVGRWVWRGPLAFSLAVLGLLALVLGVTTTAVLAVGASSSGARHGRNSPSPRGNGVDRRAPATAPGVPATDVALDPPGSPGAAAIADPTDASQVAQDIVVAVDEQSHGRYHLVDSSTNVDLLEVWMANEGGLWANNPLNTSLGAARYPHQFSTAGADTGIPVFPDIQLGIAATAATLLANRAYAGILAVLAQGTAPCVVFARAVIDSPWASSHYGGDPGHFCGVSGASGSVPPVTACLRLPRQNGHAAHGAARVPGACGRFAPRRARPHGAPSAPHRARTAHAVAPRGRGRVPGVHRSRR